MVGLRAGLRRTEVQIVGSQSRSEKAAGGPRDGGGAGEGEIRMV